MNFSLKLLIGVRELNCILIYEGEVTWTIMGADEKNGKRSLTVFSWDKQQLKLGEACVFISLF